MASTQTATQEAIFADIRRVLESGDIAKQGAFRQGEIIRELALAFRYAAGGPQPGSVNVENNSK